MQQHTREELLSRATISDTFVAPRADGIVALSDGELDLVDGGGSVNWGAVGNAALGGAIVGGIGGAAGGAAAGMLAGGVGAGPGALAGAVGGSIAGGITEGGMELWEQLTSQ